MRPDPSLPGSPHLFDGAGEVRRECRTLDWAASPLGEPASWPPELRHAFALVLGARFPMFVAWGPAGILLYNDAYAGVLGDRHPAALGKPVQVVWPELWPQVKPLIERALAGESFLGEDVRRRFERADGGYESTFSLSYSPVTLDDGTVGGAFCTVVETTARLQLQRRREFQLQLADRLRPLRSARQVIDTATAMLAEHLSLSRAEYREHLQLDHTLVLSSVDSDSAWHAEGAGALVAVPAGRQGTRQHALVAIDRAPRNWTEHDIALLQETAERVRHAIERANVEHERASAEERLNEGLLAARMMVWEWQLATGDASFSDNAYSILGIKVVHMDDIWKSIPEDDMQRMRRAHADAVDGGGTYQEVVRYRHPADGGTVWLDVRGKVRRDAQGAPFAMRGVAVDISARMRIQLGLERAEARHAFQLNLSDRLRALSDPAQILLTTTALVARYLGVSRVLCGDYDADRRTVTFHSNYTNGSVPELEGTFQAEVFGLENFAVLESGRTWVSNDMRSDPRTSAPEVWCVFEQLSVHSGIVVPHFRNGALIACLSVNANAARAWQPDEIALVEDAAARMWNAIERVRAEDALMLADRRKDQFLAMLAHELRNPLAPISAGAELLKFPGVPSAQVATTAEIISRQVRHMTGLVDDLLDVSRVTSGMVGLEIATVDMKRVVADAVEQLRPLIESRRHRCTVEVPSTPICVEGDYKRLVQVLANLLNNAAKYTPEGGTIKVTLESDGRQLGLRVADNGMGMAPELLPHVFELFSQAERTPDRTQGGLGIGLALVRSLVELHGGSVTALSEGVGHGSEFVLRMPLARDSLATAGYGAPCAAREPAQKRRVLIVDDNVDAAQMLALYLEACGHEIMVLHQAEHALAVAGAERFDVFLLDIGLPGLDGNQLARRLRSMELARGALLVAITGYGQEADQDRALDAGFDLFFVKPANPETIAAALDAPHRALTESTKA